MVIVHVLYSGVSVGVCVGVGVLVLVGVGVAATVHGPYVIFIILAAGAPNVVVTLLLQKHIVFGEIGK